MRISCVVCTYNYGHFLGRCLSSLTNQNMPEDQFEIIVVDDGSTDDTKNVLSKFSGRVKAIHQKNQGLATASNNGIISANGDYFVRIDADDELEPDALSQLSKGLDLNPRSAAVYSARTEIDSDGGSTVVRPTGEINIYELIAPGIMFRRSEFIEVGLYRPLYWEEHDLMIRFLQRHSVDYLDQPLYRYYRHRGNMTANSEARRTGWLELIEQWGIDELRKWGAWAELEKTYSDAFLKGPK